MILKPVPDKLRTILITALITAASTGGVSGIGLFLQDRTQLYTNTRDIEQIHNNTIESIKVQRAMLKEIIAIRLALAGRGIEVKVEP